MRSGYRKRSLPGQGLVEFVIILPILVLFVMLIFDLGRVAFIYSSVHNAAREGARFASIHHSTATSNEIAAAAKQLVSGMDPNELVISISYPTSEMVQVTASYQFTTVTPIITRLLGSLDNTFTLTSRASMRLEQ